MESRFGDFFFLLLFLGWRRVRNRCGQEGTASSRLLRLWISSCYLIRATVNTGKSGFSSALLVLLLGGSVVLIFHYILISSVDIPTTSCNNHRIFAKVLSSCFNCADHFCCSFSCNRDKVMFTNTFSCDQRCVCWGGFSDNMCAICNCAILPIGHLEHFKLTAF